MFVANELQDAIRLYLSVIKEHSADVETFWHWEKFQLSPAPLAADPENDETRSCLAELERELPQGGYGMNKDHGMLDSESHYYSFARPEIQVLVSRSARKILDVGCAA